MFLMFTGGHEPSYKQDKQGSNLHRQDPQRTGPSFCMEGASTVETVFWKQEQRSRGLI